MNLNPDPDLPADVRRLRESVDVFGASVQRVTVRQDHTIKRLRRTVAGLVLVYLLTLGLAGVAVWNTSRIGALHERTSREVLCPLYEIFLSLYRPDAQPPDEREAYEARFATIRHSYEVLECQ